MEQFEAMFKTDEISLESGDSSNKNDQDAEERIEAWLTKLRILPAQCEDKKRTFFDRKRREIVSFCQISRQISSDSKISVASGFTSGSLSDIKISKIANRRSLLQVPVLQFDTLGSPTEFVCNLEN